MFLHTQRLTNLSQISQMLMAKALIIAYFLNYFMANMYMPDGVLTTSKKQKFIESSILSISSFVNLWLIGDINLSLRSRINEKGCFPK